MAPRVLVFGAGAIGSTYAYILSRQLPASNIVCVCRSNYDAISENGITLNSTIWGVGLKAQPAVARSVTEAVGLPYDYVIVTAKAIPSTPSIAETIKPAVTPGRTTIVLIQNGIGIEDEYALLFPDNPLLSTVVYLPATQTSPGVISHKEIELLHVGTFPSSSPQTHTDAATAFIDLLSSCSATAKFSPDVQVERWSKLVVNAAWNPVCALTLSRDAEFLHSSGSASDYIKSLMNEISRIALASGYPQINDSMIEYQLTRALKRDLPGVEPSMLADVRAGRNLEVDAILGNTVKIAEEKKVDVPLLKANLVLLRALDQSIARSRGVGEEGRGKGEKKKEGERKWNVKGGEGLAR